MNMNRKLGPEYQPIEPMPVATSDEVRQIRNVMGLTQTQAADRVGVSSFTWWRWEAGKRPITEYYSTAIRGMYEEFLSKGLRPEGEG